ncbi:hypothetical protein WA026_023834 [Henosepilachna vigintioctopunctata]|uniref:Uncharacterized protein n=1 Tax=Henosepilachna vigintioctopunctata TaxID=420089 RepID=A0AAW1VJT0_9CUCU
MLTVERSTVKHKPDSQKSQVRTTISHAPKMKNQKPEESKFQVRTGISHAHKTSKQEYEARKPRERNCKRRQSKINEGTHGHEYRRVEENSTRTDRKILRNRRREQQQRTNPSMCNCRLQRTIRTNCETCQDDFKCAAAKVVNLMVIVIPLRTRVTFPRKVVRTPSVSLSFLHQIRKIRPLRPLSF